MSGRAGNKNDRNPISGSAAKGTTEIQLFLPIQSNTVSAYRRSSTFLPSRVQIPLIQQKHRLTAGFCCTSIEADQILVERGEFCIIQSACGHPWHERTEFVPGGVDACAQCRDKFILGPGFDQTQRRTLRPDRAGNNHFQVFDILIEIKTPCTK